MLFSNLCLVENIEDKFQKDTWVTLFLRNYLNKQVQSFDLTVFFIGTGITEQKKSLQTIKKLPASCRF